ncbi:MAG: hypothetical protein F8N37_12065 [Telmatospirillum sp.]|nr:hypothetical protein [Telmatospirillum sp.]
MALASYPDLLAFVPKLLFNRRDLADQLPDFVRLGQVRINVDLSVSASEQEIPLAGVAGSRFVDISAIQMNEPRGLWLTAYSPRQPIDFILPEIMGVVTTPGRPLYWTIDGGAIAFDRPCDAAYPFAFRIIANWQLSDVSPTNFLMANYPNVYLYATLCEIAPYLGNDALTAKWEAKYKQAVDGASRNMGRIRALSTARVDGALQQRRRSFNIYRG